MNLVRALVRLSQMHGLLRIVIGAVPKCSKPSLVIGQNDYFCFGYCNKGVTSELYGKYYWWQMHKQSPLWFLINESLIIIFSNMRFIVMFVTFVASATCIPP